MTGISFVVTVYNKSSFLPQVLGAVMSQDGDFAREIIIVDDGSTDDSLAVIRQLCAGRSDVTIIAQKNAGPAKATNAGVKAATLPWLKIVDGDDVLAPHAARRLLGAATALGARFAVGSNIPYSAGGRAEFSSPQDGMPYRRDLFAECLRIVPVNLTPTLIDRDLYWEAGGCDERLFTQDLSLLLRISWREQPAAIDGVVSAAPVEAGARVSDNQRLMLKETNQAMIYFLAETEGVPAGVRRRIVERAFGRAWKWQRRRLGASLASRWFWLYALAKVAPSLAMPSLPKTLDAFVDSRAVSARATSPS